MEGTSNLCPSQLYAQCLCNSKLYIVLVFARRNYFPFQVIFLCICGQSLYRPLCGNDSTHIFQGLKMTVNVHALEKDWSGFAAVFVEREADVV